MPAFLSKVFSRGKDKDKDKDKDGLKEPVSPSAKQSKRASRASAHSLLEGKFEAVSPSISPTAEKYEEKEQVTKKDREKEKGGIFRPKSRTTSGNGAAQKQEEVPRLTLDLNLTSAKGDLKKRDLSIVYEGDSLLDDAVLGQKRLSPAEALKLMRACLSVLTSRGLETLGIMHPHWYSASPAAQRRLISLFISSLGTPSDTSSQPNGAASAFDSELEFIRSPHDVAAVFRWALRHVKLEEDTFDKDSTPSLAWYDSFTEKEKKAEYPRTAYSDLLLPVIKPPHVELLDSTLSLVSRLASHSEGNGVSGSKLSMSLGHYVITGNRVENIEDWLAFYSQWERAGRAMEHIFLASLRDEEAKTGIPKRLSELVIGYPFTKYAVDDQFPRPPRFGTRAHDALYVRITTESLRGRGRRVRDDASSLLQIVENALKSDVRGVADNAEFIALWEDIRKRSGLTEEPNSSENTVLDKSMSNVFSDDSIRILSLRSDRAGKSTPTISMFTPVPEHDSMFDAPAANGRTKITDKSASVSRQPSETTSSSPVAADWTMFSSAGFGETSTGQSLAATLLDSDLEKTEPRKITPHRSLKKSRSPARSSRASKSEQAASPSDTPPSYKTAQVSLVKIDESFVDFWSDALLDAISNAWPTFVVCQLKSDAVLTYGDKKVAWLVIEQRFIEPPQPESPSPARRAGSPRPSLRSEGESRPGVVGRVSATFTSRKRFNFFGSQTPSSPMNSGSEKRESKAIGKGVKVNELGELIPEEESAPAPPSKASDKKVPRIKAPSVPEKSTEEVSKENSDKADVAAGTAAVAVGAGAMAVVADAVAEAVAPKDEESSVPIQDKEGEEPAKEEADSAPAKEVKSATDETSAQVLADEPAAAPTRDQGPPIEVHTDEVAEAEVASTQPESALDDADSGSEAETLREEFDQPEVEALAVPEPPPANVAASTASAVEEVAPVAEPEEATAAAPVPSSEERAVAGAHQGAGESRFIEHIDSSPDEKPVVDETSAGQISHESNAETVGVEQAEDVPESPAPEGISPAAQEDTIPPVEEPPTAAPITEDPVKESVDENAASRDVSSTPVVEAADEPDVHVVEDAKGEVLDEASPDRVAEETTPIIDEDSAPIAEMHDALPTDTPADETTFVAKESRASLPEEHVTPAAAPVPEETIIEEDSVPVVEEPVAPVAVEGTDSHGVDESSPPALENETAETDESVGDAPTEHVVATDETKSEVIAESVQANGVGPAEEKAGEPLSETPVESVEKAEEGHAAPPKSPMVSEKSGPNEDSTTS